MKQLSMRRESAPVKSRELPQGYFYEAYSGKREQIDDWLELCFEALIPTKEEKWFTDTILQYPDLCPERDLFFVIEQSTGRRVATSGVPRRRGIYSYGRCCARRTRQGNRARYAALCAADAGGARMYVQRADHR